MDHRYIWIIVSVLTSVSSSFGSQVITTSFGKTATLQCQIENLDSDLQSLYWRKDGTTIYSRTSNGEHNNGKYSVVDAASLVIPDVTESDAGNYSCKVVFRQSFATEESDVMQLYVIDVYVSHCKDTGQEVDGCSCSINGSNITSLQCSASGFPHPPVFTWEEDSIIYLSSSVDLTRFSENFTLICKARDDNLKGALENKTVCVYYTREATSTAGPPVETTTASVNDRAAIIVLSTILIMILVVFCLAAAYRRKKVSYFLWKTFRLPPTIMRTSTPKATGEPPTRCNSTLRVMNGCGYDAECVDVLKDSLKNSKASSVGDISALESGITSNKDEPDAVDFSQKDGNQDVVVGAEQPPLLVGVGLVLLDDLRSAPEETKKSIKAAVVALVDKRVEPYKNHQSHVDPNVTIHSSSKDMNGTLQKSMTTEGFRDPDAAFVYMVLKDLDGILDERDRDECEILITMPDFHEVTDESQIPAYQRNIVIPPSLLMKSSMTSSMTSSMVAGNPLSTVLREELVKKPSERAAIRNAISQIILDFMKAGHSGLKVNNYLNCSTAMLQNTNVSSYAHDVVDEEVSRLVAFWTSKTVKLDNSVNNRIKKYLFPLKPRNINKSSDSVLLLQTRKEEDEIPDTPSTARLLEEKCRDSGYSNNYKSSN